MVRAFGSRIKVFFQPGSASNLQSNREPTRCIQSCSVRTSISPCREDVSHSVSLVSSMLTLNLSPLASPLFAPFNQIIPPTLHIGDTEGSLKKTNKPQSCRRTRERYVCNLHPSISIDGLAPPRVFSRHRTFCTWQYWRFPLPPPCALRKYQS